jgi:hypothetical protein
MECLVSHICVMEEKGNIIIHRKLKNDLPGDWPERFFAGVGES